VRRSPSGALPDIYAAAPGPGDQLWYGGQAVGGHSVVGWIDVKTGDQGSHEVRPDSNFTTVPVSMTLGRDGQMWAVSPYMPLLRISTDGPRTYVVAIRGRDGHLHSRLPGESWVDLGGSLARAPSVARFSGRNYYVAEWTDHHVYVRTDRHAWQPLGGACADALVTMLGTQLIASCVDGTFTTHQVRTGRMPTTASYRNSGAAGGPGGDIEITAGSAPAFIAPSGAWQFSAARDFSQPGDPPRLTVGWGMNSDWILIRQMPCATRPTATRAAGIGYLACINAEGRLIWSTSRDGVNWSLPKFTGSNLVHEPGLADQPDGTVLAFFERSDGRVQWAQLARGGAGPVHDFGAYASMGVAAAGPG
jgi:hypothetical protein